VIFLIAFLSLLAQITLLVGDDGLLPARDFLVPARRLIDAPTVFWLRHDDAALRAAAGAGAVLSLGLVLNVAPRWCLVLLWALYLSFVTVGQEFFAFQWDNLLLESAFFSFFLAPRGLRPRSAPPPHPIAVFLMLWLLVRLHVESGLAKLLLGDPTWRDLTAMATYYETAPLPTWVGWWVHQMPLAGHQASGVFMYLVELALPLLIWGPARVRAAVFVAMVAMQVSILLTGNYGFFNYLSIALALFVLDDRQLGRSAPPAAAPRQPWALRVAAGILVPLTLVPFLSFVAPLRPVERSLLPVRWVLNSFRSINAYHLFAQMTLVRREAVIEGSADGDTWLPYEFRYKPGDPNRPPPFVAPHQPRVDFQLWFLLLGPRPGARYFDTLLARLLTTPEVVAPLFSENPFPTTPPRLVRVSTYRYRFTDLTTRRATGAWWQRDLEGRSRPLTTKDLHR
jgi:hypothetical protein